jgi:hypothetical protein
MPKYDPYYDLAVKTNIVGGTVDVAGDYTYVSGTDGFIRLENGRVSVANVSVVKESDQSQVLTLANGTISGLAADYPALTMAIDSVSLSGGDLKAILLADGNIDLLDLVQPTILPSGEPGAVADTSDLTLSYSVDQVDLTAFSLQLVDQRLPDPTILAIEDLQSSLKNIRSEANAAMAVKFQATLHSGGSLSAEGTATLSPMGAEMDLDVAAMDLKAGNPYLAHFSNTRLENGLFNLQGNASLTMGNKMETGFRGAIWIDALHLVERSTGDDLARLTKLSVSGIEYSSEPAGLKIGDISLVDPRTVVQVAEDGTTNLSRAFLSKEVARQPEEPSRTATGLQLPFPIEIGSLRIENAGAQLIDRSVSPPANLGIESLSGTVAGLSSEELARADLDLQGKLVGGTQLDISGEINPLIADRYSDVTVRFQDFNLTAVSPYVGKYAGYSLTKGKLSFDLEYQISHAELSGENILIIDQLTLGERVESEDAVNLPIPLAISLLQDQNGIIEIDVPVRGNLNDPEFGFGRVIGRALLNVLTKLITSPFSMLGGLIPGGADIDLSQVEFAAGSPEATTAVREKLDLLASALVERPTLKLEIIGGAGGPEDILALKRELLEDNLRTLHWRSLQDSGNDQMTLDEVELAEADRPRLVTIAFQTMFPDAPPPEVVNTTEAEPIEPAPDQPIAQAKLGEDVMEERKGPIRRFINIIFGETETTETTGPRPPLPQPVTSSSPESQWSVEAMKARLLDAMNVDQAALEQLADARSEAVREYLESVSGIAADRLFIAKTDDPATINSTSGLPRVRFNLE